MPGQVPKAVREERARRLIAVGNKLARDYRAAQVGQRLEVLIEETDENGAGHGYTAQYIACAVPGGEPGQIVSVTITGLLDDGLAAELERE